MTGQMSLLKSTGMRSGSRCSDLHAAALQSLAVLLSDGSVAVFAAAEQDFWGEGDDAAAALEADDGIDSEALLQPQRCVSVGGGGQGFWHR